MPMHFRLDAISHRRRTHNFLFQRFTNISTEKKTNCDSIKFEYNFWFSYSVMI